jgi:hypothetical protein
MGIMRGKKKELNPEYVASIERVPSSKGIQEERSVLGGRRAL